MHIEDAVQRAVTLLTLAEVASWQVPGLICGETLRAGLPALQRGSVWRPAQVETLWDSIIRGFPIGSFMLMPYERSLGQQHMLLAPEQQSHLTHLLLDGQQRATSVALGFYAPWTAAVGASAPAALWLDLGAPASSDRDFHFRMVTRAHPWGYPASGERQRLELGQMRLAAEAFRAACPRREWKRRPPVEVGWPWDSIAPVPVAALLAAAVDGADGAALGRALDGILPHWRSIRTRASDGATLEAHVQSASTAILLGRLRRTLERYCIPAQTIEGLMHGGPVPGDGDAIRPDATETLFVRVNSGGTPLQGEDLIYSITKAIWPFTPELIHRIKNRFVSEPRAVLLIARLATVEQGQNDYPGVPDVARFRHLIHGRGSSGFRARMEAYLSHEAAPLFEQARSLLTARQYGLPPVLAAELARGDAGRDIMFLLLYWIERLNAAGKTIDTIKDAQRARVIGALTAISWFARRSDRCVRILWEALTACKPDELPNFFCRKYFGRCLQPVSNEAPLPCLPPPGLLRAQFEARITRPGRHDGAFSDPRSSFWTDWNWERFTNQIHVDLGQWYTAVLPEVAEDDDEHLSVAARKVQDWDTFANRLYHARSLVLYAQRAALWRWFDDFDPTDPYTMEEINRPWDMDHILPSFYLKSRRDVPQIIRDWHGSIGNLRAWPLDANRSDAETSPRVKLEEVSAATRAYGMGTTEDLCTASFIPKGDLQFWRDCTPNPAFPFPDRYLALAKEHGECRKALIKSITSRVLALYTEWYEQSKIGSLMPQADF